MFAPEMALLHQWGRFSLVQGELNPPSCCILYQREPSPLVHEALVFRCFSTSSGLRPASELARCHSRGSHATGAFCAFGFVPPVTKAGFSEFFRTNVKGYRAPSARPFPSQPSYRVSAAIAPPRADPLRGSLRSRAADSGAWFFRGILRLKSYLLSISLRLCGLNMTARSTVCMPRQSTPVSSAEGRICVSTVIT